MLAFDKPWDILDFWSGFAGYVRPARARVGPADDGSAEIAFYGAGAAALPSEGETGSSVTKVPPNP